MGAALPQVGAGLGQILMTLRTATGNAVPIVGMNYYNPYLAAWLEGIPPDGADGPAYAALTSQLATALNDQTLELVYGAASRCRSPTCGPPSAAPGRRWSSGSRSTSG